jgi:hypothetical protein
MLSHAQHAACNAKEETAVLLLLLLPRPHASAIAAAAAHTKLSSPHHLLGTKPLACQFLPLVALLHVTWLMTNCNALSIAFQLLPPHASMPPSLLLQLKKNIVPSPLVGHEAVFGEVEAHPAAATQRCPYQRCKDIHHCGEDAITLQAASSMCVEC